MSFRGPLLPKTLWGRIAVGAGFLLTAGAAIFALLAVRSFLLHDQHFTVQAADSIEVTGGSRLTQAQLLSIFGEDVDRNIFNLPLAERRAELESLPWVAHATVMRLLPNRVKVAIVERTPVAFVRQGAEIGLVDRNGVLFDLPDADDSSAGAGTGGDAAKYSFPVLTGIASSDPLSTRAARMKIYLEFIAELDANGEGISHLLSEVDVSNPEDVKAVLSDAGTSNGGTSNAEILVHFGEEKYLERYHQYQTHLVEWRAQYPNLASVDLRYDQQVVLEMQKDSAEPSGAAVNPATSSAGVAAGSSLAGATGSIAPAAKTAPGAAHPTSAKMKAAKVKAAAVKAAKAARSKSKPAGRDPAKLALHSSPIQIPTMEAGQ